MTCPRCFSDAELSVRCKRDGVTEICEICSLEESLIEWYKIKQKESEIPAEVMEREIKFSNNLFQKNGKSL